jgi:hypothetical protein
MARKMVLVPVDFAQQQQQQQQQPVAFPSHAPQGSDMNQLSGLDREMRSILDNPTMSPALKLRNYYYALRRYDAVLDNMEQPTVPVKIRNDDELDKKRKAATTTTKTVETGVLPADDADILDSIPKAAHRAGRLLLKYIKENPDLSWRPTTNEMLYRGVVVPHSNIFDLVGDLMRNRKNQPEPVGWRQFSEALAKQNVPRLAIGNRQRWQYLTRQRDNEQRGEEEEEEPLTPASAIAGPSTSRAASGRASRSTTRRPANKQTTTTRRRRRRKGSSSGDVRVVTPGRKSLRAINRKRLTWNAWSS